MVITRPTFKSWPIRSGLQPHFQCSLFNSAFVVTMLTRATGTPVDSTEDTKRQDLFSVSVRFWPLSLSDFFARPCPSCSILTFGRPSFADHPRAFFSSGDYSTALCRTTPTQFDLRKTSVITYKFFFVGLFLLRPYSRLQISRLQIWFVMGAYCFVFPRSICFYVVSSSACIHLKIFLPHLDLFRVLWPCKFLERDTES